MAHTTANPSPRRRRSALKIALVCVGALVVLLVGVFFYVTSSSFLKSTVLPRAGKALNSEITVGDATIHPFSSVTLRNLKLTPNSRETLLTATEVRANYNLWQILRGNILVEDITIAGATVHLVERPDGSSNLDPVLQAVADADKAGASQPGEGSKPTRVDIRKLSISNATVRREKLHVGGGRDLTEISNAGLHLANLRNGDSGKLLLTAEMLIENTATTGTSGGTLRAAMNGEYVFAMSADLKPLSVKGEAQLKVTSATGAFSDLNALGATMAADVAPTEITELALQFAKSNETLGQLRISGPFSTEKMEGQLRVDVLDLDRRVLNLLGAASAVDFGTTAIRSTNVIRMANAGTSIQLNGRFTADRLQLIRTNHSTPVLNLAASYNLAVDTRASNAVLRAFTLNGTQDDKALLRGELDSPMTISFGGARESVGDSTLNLAVENLNLADWKSFVGDIPTGTVTVRLALRSKGNASDWHLQLRSELANVAPLAGDKTLQSAAVTGDLAIGIGDANRTAIRGGVQLSNAVVRDPANPSASPPLAATLDVDTTVSDAVVDLRQLQLTLTPTDLATNQIRIQGRVDLSDTNALQGQLQLTAESLDLTSYYDIFVSGDSKTATSDDGAPSTPPPSQPAPETEPEATQLPFKDFHMNASIQRFVLREIAISNLVASILLDGGRVRLKPVEMQLNGAPVEAAVDLELGVPGYRYDARLSALHVPFAPLVNTFQPARKGELGGTLSATAVLRGQGITGVNLQKHLAGNFDIATTNLNLSAANIRQPILKLLVSVVAMVPHLAQNPEAALGNLVSGFGSSLRGAGGLTGDLTNSPIDVIAFRGTAGNGKVEVEQATVRSTIFQADAHGTVTLAPVLTNSEIHFPVTIALVRPLAERLKMVPANTSTGAAYVKLPDFFTETGTLGNPRAQIDKKALAGSILQQVGGLIPGASDTNSAIGNVIQGIGGLLGNRQTTATNPPPGTISTPGTNQPAGTPAPLTDVLKLLGPRTKPQPDEKR